MNHEKRHGLLKYFSMKAHFFHVDSYTILVLEKYAEFVVRSVSFSLLY
jgi:hypothetical protein